VTINYLNELEFLKEMNRTNQVLTTVALGATGLMLFYQPSQDPIDTTSSGVVIIDMQERSKYDHFISGDMLAGVHPRQREEIIKNQRAVIDYATGHGLPVYNVEDADFTPTLPQVNGGFMFTKVNGDHTHGLAAINPHRETLEETLRGNSIDTLLVMGIYTSACVHEFTVYALERGFTILLSDDLMADPFPNPADTNATLQEYRRTKSVTYRNDYKDLLSLFE